MRPSIPLLLISALSLLPACGKKPDPAPSSAPADAASTPKAQKSTGNQAPRVVKIRLDPPEPKTDEPIQAIPDGQDPEGDSILFSYQWYVNGKKILGEIASSLSPEKSAHGDEVSVEVVANDGQQSGEALKSASVIVRNSGPKLLNSFQPGMSLDGFRLEVSDADGDPITYSLTGGPPGMTLDEGGTLHWKSSPEDKGGSYTPEIVASDGQGGKVSLKFNVTVNPGRPAGAPAPAATP